jgi:hypothetical protein
MMKFAPIKIPIYLFYRNTRSYINKRLCGLNILVLCLLGGYTLSKVLSLNQISKMSQYEVSLSTPIPGIEVMNDEAFNLFIIA